MPGVLKRTHDRIDSGDTDAVPATMAADPPRKRQALEGANGHGGSNGVLPAVNGVYANGVVMDETVSGNALNEVVESQSSQVPPEIFHVTEGFLPLSRLVERLAQDTRNGLEELVSKMADMPQPQANGYGGGQSSSINIQKKTMLWEFAQDRRVKFIKLLVLSQWGRQSEAVSKVIDINHWITSQKACYKEAANWMGELKRILIPMKLPAPDLKAALEALSTSKIGGMPDIGYIPTKPLSPKQLLKALRGLNTLLTVRLNVHEKIPPEMMNFTVGSGRATFHVREEFELDVSIADKDPSSQLYFIDFRFLFSPCVREVPEGPLRDHLEGKTNDILRRQGLTACYEFLHDFVLTYKLSILRDQAREMARGHWSENIRVEAVRRSLVVQYWLHRPGGKSWIEIGIKSGRKKGTEYSTSNTPYISLRCHRHGKEVLDHDVEMDLANLSTEDILSQIIAKHTNFIFKATKRKLKARPIYSKGLLSVKHRAHPSDPRESSLKVQVTKSSTVTVFQDPISGAFALSPPSALQCQFQLNTLKDPSAHAESPLAVLRNLATLEAVQNPISILGWKAMRTWKVGQETLKRLFGSDQLRIEFFSHKGWDRAWVLALTTSMDGDKWWVVETRAVPMNPTPEDYATSANEPFRHALQINITSDPVLVFEPTWSALKMIEKMAGAMISQYVDCRHLSSKKIQYRQLSATNQAHRSKMPELSIKFKQDGAPELLSTRKYKRPWCHEIIKCRFLDLSASRTHVISAVSGRFSKPLPILESLARSIDSNLAFHPPSSGFVFKLSTPVGKPSCPAIWEQFNRIENLIDFIDTAIRFKLVCTRVSLTSLTFTYSEPPNTTNRPIATSNPQPSLSATVSFPPDGPVQISFERGNPHLHIADFLQGLLNGSDGLDHVVVILRKTLPLLRALTSIENIHRDGSKSPQFFILPRSIAWYAVRYTGLGTILDYELRLRERAGTSVWFATAKITAIPPEASKNDIKSEDPPTEANETPKNNVKAKQNTKPTPNNKISPAKPTIKPDPDSATGDAESPPRLDLSVVKRAWNRLTKEQGPGWRGLGQGIAAEIDGAEACVLRIDEMMSEIFSIDASPSDEQVAVKVEKEPVVKTKPPGVSATSSSVNNDSAPKTQASAQKKSPVKKPTAAGLNSGSNSAKRIKEKEVVVLD